MARTGSETARACAMSTNRPTPLVTRRFGRGEEYRIIFGPRSNTCEVTGDRCPYARVHGSSAWRRTEDGQEALGQHRLAFLVRVEPVVGVAGDDPVEEVLDQLCALLVGDLAEIPPVAVARHGRHAHVHEDHAGALHVDTAE